MNVAEFTETEVHEMSEGSDRPDLERMTTNDYLEILMKKKGIPRTTQKKQHKSKNPMNAKKMEPKTPPAEHEEPSAPPQLTRQQSSQNEPQISGRDSAISILTTKVVQAPI